MHISMVLCLMHLMTLEVVLHFIERTLLFYLIFNQAIAFPWLCMPRANMFGEITMSSESNSKIFFITKPLSDIYLYHGLIHCIQQA